jgi:hypothetical protein
LYMLDLFLARFPAYPSDAGVGKNDPDTISFIRKIAAGLLARNPPIATTAGNGFRFRSTHPTMTALEPFDDLAAGGLPYALAGADVAEHLVEMADAPGLAHDPRVQMQHHQPPGGRAVGIEPVFST